MTLLSLDTEGAGISLRFPLLSLTLAIVGDNFEHNEVLDLKVKPDETNGRTEYLVEDKALEVNGINLVEHSKVATPYRDAKPIIYKWLQEMHGKYGTLTPLGNNVARDARLICHYTISEGSWHSFVDRRVLDLISIGQMAKMLGLIPEDQSLALSKIAEYFGVEIDQSLLHTAIYDVAIGTQVYYNYHKLFNK